MTRGPFTPSHIVWNVTVFLTVLGAATMVCLGADWGPRNLALSALGAKAHTWEPGVTVIPEHEPSKVNDGSVHTYWTVRASDLPADIGVEWRKAQKVSSVVVRYFDGRMVRGPVMARTQEWARLQYWDQHPTRGLSDQLPSSRRGRAVVLGTLFVSGNAPFSGNPTFLLQALECGVERPVFHLERLFRQALNGLGNAVPVSGAPAQGAQNQHVERAINKFDWV